MIVKVKRQDGPGQKPYWENFRLEPEGRKTVAGILEILNYRDDMEDAEGKAARRIRWECSCMQKVCGACAMVINGMPALACCTFIDTDKEETLTLEPLSKFPVICDLKCDRSAIQEHQKQAMLYQGQKAETIGKELDNQYKVGKCLKCGLCLEVCPNYTGEEGSAFYGAVFANEAYLLSSSSNDRKAEIGKAFDEHFAGGCSKALSCREICPMEMPTLSSIGYLTRGKK